MADFAKLDWFASWQNALCFLIGIGAVLWLGPLSAEHSAFVFIVVFAGSRLALAIVTAIIRSVRRR